MKGILTDCISDVQIVAGCVNDDHSGGDEGFPMGLVCLNGVTRGRVVILRN
jgi:hypothetical protein